MTILEPICFKCRHFNIQSLNCVAFMNEIPEEIIIGNNDHSNPLPGQLNNIVFQSIDKGSLME